MDQRAIARDMVNLLDGTTEHILPRKKIELLYKLFERYLSHTLIGEDQNYRITKVSRAILKRLFDKKMVKAGCLIRLGRDADYRRELDDLSMILMCVRTLLGDDHALAIEMDRIIQGTGYKTKEIQYEYRNSNLNFSNNTPDDRHNIVLPGDSNTKLPKRSVSRTNGSQQVNS
ncbi:hypothetical protein [Microbulbifer discodermiae]|uniref:hypothetical protein n=1 Tax=Microbulbifer sp. 2201CG32-9 TaxID=3232309 RepID=UPI00345BDCDC